MLQGAVKNLRSAFQTCIDKTLGIGPGQDGYGGDVPSAADSIHEAADRIATETSASCCTA
jgi:hypothetical protein